MKGVSSSTQTQRFKEGLGLHSKFVLAAVVCGAFSVFLYFLRLAQARECVCFCVICFLLHLCVCRSVSKLDKL